MGCVKHEWVPTATVYRCTVCNASCACCEPSVRVLRPLNCKFFVTLYNPERIVRAHLLRLDLCPPCPGSAPVCVSPLRTPHSLCRWVRIRSVSPGPGDDRSRRASPSLPGGGWVGGPGRGWGWRGGGGRGEAGTQQVTSCKCHFGWGQPHRSGQHRPLQHRAALQHCSPRK